MKDSIETLTEFLQVAENSRKYPSNTASAYRTALKLFEVELKDEERNSVEKFRENLSSIYASVFNKNKTNYSTASLDVYRRRVSKLIGDYFSYGMDPLKMNNWKPALRSFTGSKPKNENGKQKVGATQNFESEGEEVTNGKGRIEWPFNVGRKAILILPEDLTEDEARTLQQLINLKIGEKATE